MEDLSSRDELLIDKHLMGNLSSEEQSIFDERMKDPEFADQVSAMSSVKKAADQKGKEQMRAEFREIDKKLDKINGSRPFPSWLKWLIGIIVIGALGYLLYNNLSPKTPKNERIFAEFYQPMPNMVAPIEKGQGDASIYNRAFRSYERKEYEKAVQLFGGLELNDDASLFYHAASLLALDRTEEAIRLFSEVAPLPESEFKDAAEWYIVLSHLKANDSSKAMAATEAITENEEHKYVKAARSIVKRLE